MNSKHNWPAWRIALTVLNLIALVLSGVLSWHYLQGGPIAGCNGENSCEQVLGSQWSLVAGTVPVSALALGVYLAMFVTSFFIGHATETSLRRFAWSAMLIIAGAIGGSAIWFIIVQKWIIK